MDKFQRMPSKGAEGASATRVVLYIVLASIVSALATVGLCVGVLYGAYGALLSPAGAAKLSAIVNNVNVSDGAITGLLIGNEGTPHNLLFGAGTDETNFTGAWIKFGVDEYPGLLFEDIADGTSLLPVMHIASHVATAKEHMLSSPVDGESPVGRYDPGDPCYLNGGRNHYGFTPPDVLPQCVYHARAPAGATLHYTGVWPETTWDMTAGCSKMILTVNYTLPRNNGDCGMTQLVSPCKWVSSRANGIYLVDDNGYHINTRRAATTRVVPGDSSGHYFQIYVLPMDNVDSSDPIAIYGDRLGIGGFTPPFVPWWAAGRAFCADNPP